MTKAQLKANLENLWEIALAKGYHEEEIVEISQRTLVGAFKNPPEREIKSVEILDGSVVLCKFRIGDRVPSYDRSTETSFPVTISNISVAGRGVYHDGVIIVIDGVYEPSDTSYRVHRFVGVEKDNYRLEHYPLK